MPKEPTKNPGTVRFTARLEGPKERSGWLVFPYSVKELYGVRGYVSVVATVEGVTFRTSVGGLSVERAQVYISRRRWRRLRKMAGKTVEAAVTLYSEAREFTVPFAFKVALLKRPAALVRFRKLSHLRQREYLCWMNELGLEAVRKRRMARAIQMLAEGKPLTSGGSGQRRRATFQVSFGRTTHERGNRDV